MATVSDDKAAECDKKPVCDEVAMEDVSGTIIEEVVVRAAKKVEAHIPLAKGHEKVLLEDELTEEPKAEAKDASL